MNVPHDPHSRSTGCSAHGDLLLSQLVDEFLAAIERGESPSLEALAARNPEHADIILQTVPRLLSVRLLRGDSANAESAGGLPTVDETLNELGVLGDFQPIREIGRGGMGVVYEAEQLSLHRRVALKVLPFAALLDTRRLERFQQEAHAAATLKHDNIVTVYCVGCERGVHYYAMELIRGHSLASVLTHLRRTSQRVTPQSGSLDEFASFRELDEGRTGPPADTGLSPTAETLPIAALSTQHFNSRSAYFLSIARLVAQLARAMHYAHERGVIHRDLKPSNLLLDELGKPSVTDFGLAQVHDNRGLTMTGDLLGTLRYMSPEQARGKRVLDERTDIYSLGVTLYELVTLRPSFDTDDRKELLKLIENAEPVPPRRHDARIPKDLETIILKSMAEEASDRYDSAAEMADDLQRFLDSKPIRARRASTTHRLVRWVQRHRVVSILAGALILVILGLAIIGPLLAIQYARLASAEMQARQEATTSRQELSRILADSLSRTISALEDSPGTSQLQRAVVQDTLRLCELLTEPGRDDPDVQYQVGRAFTLLGYTEALVGNIPDALQLMERAVQVQRELVERYPNEARHWYQLGGTYRMLGNNTTGIDSSRALEICASSVEALQRAVALSPDTYDYGILLDFCRQFLAVTSLECGDYTAAEELLRLANETGRGRCAMDGNREDSVECWAFGRGMMGSVYAETGRVAKAEDEFRECLNLCTLAIDDFHNTTRGRIAYASFLAGLGGALDGLRRLAEAEDFLRRSIAELEAVHREVAGTNWGSYSLEQCWIGLSRTLLAQGREDEAVAAARSAVEAWSHKPDNEEYTAWARYWLGTVLWSTGNQEEARQLFRGAIRDLERFSQDRCRTSIIRRAVAYTTCPCEELRDLRKGLELARQTCHPEDGQSLRFLGMALYRVAAWQEALDAFQQALPRLNGGDAIDYFYLAMTNTMMNNQVAARQWYEKAIAAYDGPLVPPRLEYPCFFLPDVRAEAESITNRR